MDQIVQSYVSNNQFMGSVLVARGSDVLFSKGYGSANLEWGIPDSPATKFRLEERGKLKVEDPVKKYLPDAHRLPGSPKVPIFAESETKFFPRAIDAQIDFVKDEKGAVTYLVLHQGGAQIKGARK